MSSVDGYQAIVLESIMFGRPQICMSRAWLTKEKAQLAERGIRGQQNDFN
jgi:hypothetical protein